MSATRILSTFGALSAVTEAALSDDGGGYGWEEDGEFEDAAGEEDSLPDISGITEASIKTVDDAKSAIAKIRAHVKAHGNQFDQIDQALEDFRKANAKLHERSKEAPVNATEREMQARYMEGGKLRLLSAQDSETKISTPGFFDDTPVNQIHADIQKAHEDRAIIRQLQRQAARRNLHTPYCDARIDRLIQCLPIAMRDAIKAKAFADGSGIGAEWIPDEMLPVLEREVEHQFNVAELFDTIDMNHGTMLLPFLSAGFIPYLLGEIAGDDPAQLTSSTMTTAQRTFTAKHFGARAQVGENAAEDAIFPILDAIIRPELVRALVIGRQDTLINGDTGTHQDTGLAAWNPDSIYPAAPGGGSQDHRRAYIGLRARAADVSNTTDRGTFTSTTLRTDIDTIKGPRNGPGGKAIFSSAVGISAMMLFSELITLEKYGSGATILTGEVGKVFGIPVFEPQMLTGDMNASGVYDDTTKTKSGLLVVNRGRFKWFRRRGIRLRSDLDITRGLNHLVVDRRETFGTVDGSTTKNVHAAYNMA